MADFRRLLFAFALVALLIGVSAPASAASLMNCTGQAAAAPWVRGEGYTEMAGDIIISCTGGDYTPSGTAIPQANISVTIQNATTLTSKITDVQGSGASQVVSNEALLIVDDTTSPVACGSGGAAAYAAPPAAPATCIITSDGSAGVNTYTGGNPNVFQGRQLLVSGGTTIIFQGVPLEPAAGNSSFIAPVRKLRITNLRFNAASLGITGSNSITQDIRMNVNIDSSVSAQQAITVWNASVRAGLAVSKGTNKEGLANFLQCTADASPSPGNVGNTIVISETYSTFFKVRNQSVLNANGGATYVGGAAWTGSDAIQGVTRDIRTTEAGTQLGLTNTTGGIATAGSANQGTRFGIRFATLPAGTTGYLPNVVNLVSSSVTTGVMVLISDADANGAAGTIASSTSAGWTKVSDLKNGIAVYEVLYSNPNAIESATILMQVSATKNLNASPSTPEVGPTATATVGYAPFYSPSTAGAGIASPAASKYTAGDTSSSASEYAKLNALPVPRFIDAPQGPIGLYSYTKCACDLLFPWVVGDSTFTTSLVIANTSLDPCAGSTCGAGFTAAPQSGTVTFWYYGTAGISTNPAAGASTQASQTTSVSVPAGSYLAHIVSPGAAGTTTANGLNKLSANFAGYVIAQAQFQYCHGVASISANVPGFGTQTYLGLVLDKPNSTVLFRTSQTQADVLGN